MRRSLALALALIVGLASLATVYAQKVTDNPFAPSGNPFAALGAQLSMMSGKLDQILKRLEQPSPLPPPQSTLYTGILHVRADETFACEVANVGPEPMENLEIRIVDDIARILSRRDFGDLLPGWAVSLRLNGSSTPRCEFSFEGRPEWGRATGKVPNETPLYAY